MKDNEKAEAPALKAFIGKRLFGKNKSKKAAKKDC